MITFNLKKQWFLLIRDLIKDTEFREFKPYWISRFGKLLFNDKGHIFKEGDLIKNLDIPCCFVLGYTKTKLFGKIQYIEVRDGEDTDLKHKGLVFAIHFKLKDDANENC